jgi:hypothetical protein
VFTARYALSPYIKQIRSVFKGLMDNPYLFIAFIYSVSDCCTDVCKIFIPGLIRSYSFPTTKQDPKLNEQINRPTIKIVLPTEWYSWLRHCVTSPKVAGSIPDGVIEIFH